MFITQDLRETDDLFTGSRFGMLNVPGWLIQMCVSISDWAGTIPQPIAQETHLQSSGASQNPSNPALKGRIRQNEESIWEDKRKQQLIEGQNKTCVMGTF